MRKFFIAFLFVSAAMAQEKFDIDLAKGAGETRNFAVTPSKNPKVKLVNVAPETEYELNGSVIRIVLDDNNACEKAVEDKLKGKSETEIVELKKTTTLTGCTAAELTAALAKATATGEIELTKVESGKPKTVTIERKDADRKWPLVFTAQGDPPPAPKPPDALGQQRELTAKHPSLITMTCSYATGKCSSEHLFVNADQVSTLAIVDIPTNRVLTVRATAGEYMPCPALRHNVMRFEKSPDTILIPLHMRRGVAGLFPASMAKIEDEAAWLYGVCGCPGTSRAFRPPETVEQKAVWCDKLGDDEMFADTRQARIPPDVPAVPLLVRGKSEAAEIQLSFDNGEIRTVHVPLRYQRFWLDAGGFFIFSRTVDQVIETETVAGPPEKRKVTALRRETQINPQTGIVINVHPGNYPIIAFQFGIAANDDRLPSYYLGLGLRAREIGKRGLATIAAGLAMQQEARFPDVRVGNEFAPDSARLQPVNKYGFNPYLSISLGFSFGGVSDGTNVAAAVSR